MDTDTGVIITEHMISMRVKKAKKLQKRKKPQGNQKRRKIQIQRSLKMRAKTRAHPAIPGVTAVTKTILPKHPTMRRLRMKSM